MKGENILYESVYQAMLTQLYSGVYQHGQKLPTQRQLCQQYNVGITTIRKAIHMLEEDGFIETASGVRAVVRFNGGSNSYIPVLLQRRRSIIDVYWGMELILVPLFAEGARYADLDKLRAIIKGFRPEMEQMKVHEQCSLYLAELLAPYRNSIILDLLADMGDYARVPSLPELEEEKNPYNIKGKFAQKKIQQMQDMIEQERFSELQTRLKNMYQKLGKRARTYLRYLKQQYPEVDHTVEYQWTGKDRAHLYTIVARKLYKRIISGEFDGQQYLPSVLEIVRTYETSLVTACGAVSVLNDIGVIRTVNKKGIVRREGGEWSPIRLDSKIVEEHLIYFLDVLQILVLTSERMAYAAISRKRFDSEGKQLLLEVWSDYRDGTNSTRIVQLLLEFLRVNAPYSCLKNILEQFDDILIWGHYLKRQEMGAEETAAMERDVAEEFTALCEALEQDDSKKFARQVRSIFLSTYQISRRLILRTIESSENLPADLVGS